MMSSPPGPASVADFFRLALLRLTGNGSYQPLPPDVAQAAPLSGRFPVVLWRGAQQGMAIELRFIAFCPADGLGPADLEARADDLAAYVRAVGEKGNAEFRSGGSGRQVSALLFWLCAEPVSDAQLARAAAISRTVRGSSFGRWPVDCAALDLVNGRLRRPRAPAAYWRTGEAARLVSAWRDRAAPDAHDGKALSEAQQRRQALETALGQRSAPATYALLTLIALFFVAMELSGGSTNGRVLLRYGALLGPLVLQGQWWRLVSSAFLHIGWSHLLFDAFALYIYGPLVERLYGWPRFLGIYAFTAIAGNLVSILFVGGLSAGASGAIFGLLGVTIAMLLRYRAHVPAATREPLLKNAVVVVVVNALFSVSVPGINLYAHAGGFAGGILCGLVLRPRPLFTGLPQRLIGAVVCLVLAAVGALALLLDMWAAVGMPT